MYPSVASLQPTVAARNRTRDLVGTVRASILGVVIRCRLNRRERSDQRRYNLRAVQPAKPASGGSLEIVTQTTAVDGKITKSHCVNCSAYGISLSAGVDGAIVDARPLFKSLVPKQTKNVYAWGTNRHPFFAATSPNRPFG